MSYTYTDKIKFAYTPNFDSFGRLRVSEPLTLFDSSHRFRDNGMWTTSTSGGGAATFNANQGLIDLTVTNANGDQIIRETYKVFSYQPGKSLLSLNTFVFSPTKTGLRQRVGYFGAANGIFLQLNESTLSFVERSSVTGVLVDKPISQFGGVYGPEDTGWNVDPMDGTGPSGITLDIEKAQILWMDFEWLGTGSVRCGFVINGEFYISHIFHHSNIITTTYITTACLPIRYELTNTALTASPSNLKQICSSMISEGGYELRGESCSISNPITAPYTLTLSGVYYPVISIRLKSTSLDGVAIPTLMDCFPKDPGNYQWKLIESGTTTGGSWTSLGTDSIVEYNISGTSFTGGKTIHSGFFSASNQGGGKSGGLGKEGLFDHQLARNSFTSTTFEFTLAVAIETAGGGGNQVFAHIDWEEITR